jgi:hypothetical protein
VLAIGGGAARSDPAAKVLALRITRRDLTG